MTKKASPKKKKPTLSKRATKAATTNNERENEVKVFPVVGIGASAGGLEALEGFFSHMPPTTNMAFVVIQHLSSTHKSIMGSLLEKYTAMPIHLIEDGMQIQPNHIYLNLPDKNVAIINGALHLVDPIKSAHVNLPIDAFFRSLAEDRGNKAICIILSGSAADGTLGLKVIKGEGGMAMVQQETQAKYDSMPKSAIDTGLVDFILPVEQMAAELIKYVRHPYVDDRVEVPATGHQYENYLEKIFLHLRSVTGHDFSNYKRNTTRRRIERRMAVHQLYDVAEYFQYLRQTPAEADSLFRDMLIGVTSFFRDPKAFDILRKKVLPDLLSTKEPNSAMRVWVPACATGEEAYSIAMLLMEAMEELNLRLNVQIFASDLDTAAIDFARAAVYPASIAADVNTERLSRFFVQDGARYRVKKRVREMVVFAVHDVIKDPPFSRLDILSCRNLLIYMDGVLQKKLLPIFHHTLVENGILFLGPSESIGNFFDSFEPVDLKWKFFKPKGKLPERRLEYPVVPFRTGQHGISGEGAADPNPVRGLIDVRLLAEKMVFENYAPASVLINEKHQILFFIGDTEKYLVLPTGEPTLNILNMARDGLKYKLRTAIQKAVKQKKSVVEENQQIQYNGELLTFNLSVTPLEGAGVPQGLMIVVFDEKTSLGITDKQKTKSAAEKGRNPQIVSLEHELQSTKESLQTTIEELETSNEDLKSINEEMQSVNEELQSTNEELETSKEELQSTNEELVTVNSELQEKVNALDQSANDIANLLASTDIATIFLDIDLNTRRFTPSATRLFNLIDADIGRPISQITSNILYEGLYQDAKDVIATLHRKQVEVQTKDGEWYDMRLAPYRTLDNVIDGVVITLVDVTEIRKAQIAANRSQQYAGYIAATIRQPLLVLDKTLRVVFANRSFYQVFKVTAGKTEGRLLYELGDAQWDIPDLRKLLEEVLPDKTTIEDYKVDHEFENIGSKTMLLNARRIRGEGEGELILLAIEDITEHKREK
ncbi:MAG: chemotaxis protein CheB [Dehalococcoidia bacterium]|nr:chemotaxis protein CheB [Dehalococcoidia bacterium]